MQITKYEARTQQNAYKIRAKLPRAMIVMSLLVGV